MENTNDSLENIVQENILRYTRLTTVEEAYDFINQVKEGDKKIVLFSYESAVTEDIIARINKHLRERDLAPYWVLTGLEDDDFRRSCYSGLTKSGKGAHGTCQIGIGGFQYSAWSSYFNTPFYLPLDGDPVKLFNHVHNKIINNSLIGPGIPARNVVDYAGLVGTPTAAMARSMGKTVSAVLLSEVLKKQPTMDSLSMLLSDKHHGVYRFAAGDYGGEVLSKGFQRPDNPDDEKVTTTMLATGPMVGLLDNLGLSKVCSRTVHRPPNPSVGKGKQRNY